MITENMTAGMFTCPLCMTSASFSQIESNNYACMNTNCMLSERLVVHAEVSSRGVITRLYGWVLEPGELLHGRYEIIKLLGKGGYGATYMAKDREMQNQIRAVKEIPRFYCDDKEDEFLKFLNHPSIPKLCERFNIGDLHYSVMEFIEGESLEELARNIPRSGLESRILKIAEQVCDVLSYIHSEGVIHRDLKPENVLVQRNGSVALVDFGIAKRFIPGESTRHLARAASHFYSSPEQYQAGKGFTDARSDIYSLGAILYYLLTGQEPIDAINRDPAKDIYPTPRSLNPHISSKTEQIIITAMKMDPQQRFANVMELKKALMAVGSITTRVCAKCGRLFRGSKDLCPQCGGPTHPLGFAPHGPFVFRSGEKAYHLREFIELCYQKWDEATWHLYQGDFQPWLNSIQEGALAEKAAVIQETILDRDLGLNEFLMSSPYGQPPRLAVSHQEIHFKEVPKNATRKISVIFSNVGKGYLSGQLKTSSPWLLPAQNTFTCRSGQTQTIIMTANTNGLSPRRLHHTTLTVETNVGTKLIPVSLSTVGPFYPHSEEAPFSVMESRIGNADVNKMPSWNPVNQDKISDTLPLEQQREEISSVLINQQSQDLEAAEIITSAESLVPDNKVSVIPEGKEKAVTENKLEQSNIRVKWLKILQSQWKPVLLFLTLAMIVRLVGPAISSYRPNSWVVLMLTGVGGLIGLTNWATRRIGGRVSSLVAGLVIGLVLGAVGNFAFNSIYISIESNLFAPIFQLVQAPYSTTASFINWAMLGLYIGGLVGLIKTSSRISLPKISFLIYFLIFSMVISFLLFAFPVLLSLTSMT
ncbi:MAG: protein kinase [candidate division KSB1 bacterium]|nr:protein kinase [candidate division KSB1 bacterium]